MKRTKYALISDGSSDRCLIPIIDFLLDAHFPNMVFEGEWANLAFLREPARTLHEKIQKTVEFYEPDWVFVHRDAEREENPLQKRLNEIETAIAKSNVSNSYRFIKVIPIRMIESWLLIDKNAIRKAANNPNGIVEIELPNLSKLENITNPKELLFDLIKKASGLSGRKLSNLNVFRARHLVAEYIQNYQALRQTTSFQHLEAQIRQIATEQS